MPLNKALRQQDEMNRSIRVLKVHTKPANHAVVAANPKKTVAHSGPRNRKKGSRVLVSGEDYARRENAVTDFKHNTAALVCRKEPTIKHLVGEGERIPRLFG